MAVEEPPLGGQPVHVGGDHGGRAVCLQLRAQVVDRDEQNIRPVVRRASSQAVELAILSGAGLRDADLPLAAREESLGDGFGFTLAPQPQVIRDLRVEGRRFRCGVARVGEERRSAGGRARTRVERMGPGGKLDIVWVAVGVAVDPVSIVGDPERGEPGGEVDGIAGGRAAA